MAVKYLHNAANQVATPHQRERLNERQVENSAGGFVYAVDCWKRMDRFLILGSEGGSYYASEQKLTKENLKAVEECVALDGLRAIKRIVEISDAGRAPKNDPALLALAYAAAKGDNQTRTAALDALPKVARIGTHLFHFVDFVTEFRGWGRSLRMAVADWYQNQDPGKLADQVTKYQQRDGWSHRDLMRLTHRKFTGEHQAIAHWVVKGEVSDGLPTRIQGHIELQAAGNAKEAARVIKNYGMVRESVPTELLSDPLVWDALLEKMPLTAMIRNLGNMSKCGLLAPMSDASKLVVGKLSDIEALHKSRIHPISVLVAMKTYESGHSLKGSGEWNPVPQVVDALDEAYYAAFKNVEPTGKRFYMALDISGSMWSGNVAGIPDFSPGVATGAMAMVTVKTEKNYYTAGFTSVLEKITLSPRQRLDDVVKIMQEMSHRMGSTDCAAPMIDAMKQKIPVDVFVVITDSETWAGRVHPPTALHNYRQKMGIPAKLVVMAMVPNKFSIADPMDGGMLDVVGFDTNTPAIIADFARG